MDCGRCFGVYEHIAPPKMDTKNKLREINYNNHKHMISLTFYNQTDCHEYMRQLYEKEEED